QFKSSSFEFAVPQTDEELNRYLSSGVIKGVGDKKANALIEHFGEDVLDIIRFNPSRLTEVSGIGEKTAEMITESFNENSEVMDTIVYLGKYGISSTIAMRIFKVYKENTVSIVKENPYKIISEVPGMGFKSADAIAMNLDIEADSPFRIYAGIKYSLSICYSRGHMF